MYSILHKIFGFYEVYLTGDVLKYSLKLRDLKILFWGFRPSENGYTARFSLFSLPLAAAYADDFGVEISVATTVGIPFVISKYKKRLGLLVGTFLGLALIFCSTLVVWEINVTGNKTVSDEEIIATLGEIGFGLGWFIPNTPITQIETHLLLTKTDLSSASVNIKGTYVTIDVMERQRAPEIEDNKGVCDIVASCDGIVVRIEASNGKPVVLLNETVVEGQTLIAGEYFGKNETLIQTHAKGRVFAKVYRNYVVRIPIYFEFKEYTGKKEVKTAYSVLGRDINLFLDSMIDLDYFDASLEIEEIAPFGFIKTPIKKITLTAYEYRKSLVKLTQEAAEKKAYLAYLNWIENELEGEYLSGEYQISFDPHSNSVILRATAEVVIDISRSRK